MLLSVLADADTVRAEETESVHYTTKSYCVDVTVDTQWDGYYNATVEITNIGNKTIENWTLAFDSEDSIENIWNAAVKSQKNQKTIIKNAGWNQDIAPGTSVSFGYTASCSGDMHLAEKYEILSAKKEVSENRRNVSFAVESEWEEGCVVKVTIENKSDTPIEDWCLSFDAPYEIESIWNGVIVSKENGTYVIKNSGYNSTIAPEKMVDFGYKVKGKYAEAEHIAVTEVNSDIGSENNSGSDEKDSEKDENNKNEGKEEDNPAPDEKPGIESVHTSQDMLLTNSKYFVRIWAETKYLNANTEYKMDLYQYIGNSCEKIAELQDSGNLSLYGDEIKNDGIYSGKITIREPEEKNLRYKIVLSCNGEELDSREMEITVKKQLLQEDFDQYNQINKKLEKYVSGQVSQSVTEGNSSGMTEEIEKLLADEPVKKVSAVDDWTVCVTLENGLSTYVQIADDTDKELMRRGSGSSYIETELDNFEDFDPEDYEDYEDDTDPDELDALETVESEVGYSFILSNRVLLWNPYDTEWKDADETEMVRMLTEEYAGNLNVDILSDEKADAASLEKMTDYGLVILASHGLEGKWLVTGETYTHIDMIYEEELQSGEMSVLIRGELGEKTTQMKYMVGTDWFSHHLKGRFPNSVIINNSCTSLATEDFWNVFSEKGAKTYYGYTGAVTNDYVTLQTGDLLTGLVCEGITTQEAFDYSYDRQYGDGAYFGIRGYGNMAFQTDMTCGGIMNGGFEEGLSGWQKEGDGRCISCLGSIVPTEGEKMGIISTGLGYTKELGEISQEVTVPQEASGLTFDWNFLSEEFLEYIGTRYDDPFEVSLTLKDEGQKKHTLFRVDVNSIADDFEAESNKAGKLVRVSPEIVFDNGDVWMTGWQKADVDISDYAGQQVTLIFSVRDAADTAYTTAILLDKITFDQGNLASCEETEVSDEYSDAAFRTMYGKGGTSIGQSYVFNNPDDFTNQAKREQKTIKSVYGYKSKKQVTMIPINTQKEFVKEWNALPQNGTDRVSLLFHGSFYAIVIKLDEDKNINENLTTNPNGTVSSAEGAVYIRNLKKKTIGMINILTCNGGVLDAIDYNDNVTISTEYKKKKIKKTFKIRGNVAQAFLDSQDVKTVKAWDGSLGYFPIKYIPMLAVHQDAFKGKLKMLKKKRVHKPIRGKIIKNCNTGKITYKKNQSPSGEAVYIKLDGKMTCVYKIQYIRIIGTEGVRVEGSVNRIIHMKDLG